jgi:hypothetical protein
MQILDEEHRMDLASDEACRIVTAITGYKCAEDGHDEDTPAYNAYWLNVQLVFEALMKGV